MALIAEDDQSTASLQRPPGSRNELVPRFSLGPWHLATLVCAALMLWGLGGYTLIDPDDGRYAEIPREMIQSGDFVLPHLNYVPYLEKPPLMYWATAASFKIFG
ncbi:MAG: ArnT family glycosyltransferase, partial [Bacteroidota bacterium]